MDRVNCIVIGAGVIGLAIARQISMKGYDVIILESQKNIGSGISSRNSEVIHSGIYYQPGSLKAKLCVEGQRLLYAYCGKNNIATNRCGKLIVSNSEEQSDKLHKIWRNAMANHVLNLRLLDKSQAKAMEPELCCIEALHSPDTGIIDSHAYMLQLLADAESTGTSLAFQTEVIGVRINANGFELKINSPGMSDFTIAADRVVNAAGLSATRLAKSFQGLPEKIIPTISFAKGNYFSMSGKSPFSRLIYPIPEPGGLGTHLTFDLAGQVRFGPDVEWLGATDDREINYNVDQSRSEQFYKSIRDFWPAIPPESLQPAYSGVRPKLSPTGEEHDFIIQGPNQHGINGLINLFGIESPGLTASLAIAQYVVELIQNE